MKKLFLSALVPCLILVSGCQYPWQTNETSPQSALEESKSETGENVVEVSESQIESRVPVGTGSETDIESWILNDRKIASFLYPKEFDGAGYYISPRKNQETVYVIYGISHRNNNTDYTFSDEFRQYLIKNQSCDIIKKGFDYRSPINFDRPYLCDIYVDKEKKQIALYALGVNSEKGERLVGMIYIAQPDKSILLRGQAFISEERRWFISQEIQNIYKEKPVISRELLELYKPTDEEIKDFLQEEDLKFMKKIASTVKIHEYDVGELYDYQNENIYEEVLLYDQKYGFDSKNEHVYKKYINNDLGISFIYNQHVKSYIDEKDGKLSFMDYSEKKDEYYSYGQDYIEIYEKNMEESFEDAVKRIILEQIDSLEDCNLKIEEQEEGTQKLFVTYKDELFYDENACTQEEITSGVPSCHYRQINEHDQKATSFCSNFEKSSWRNYFIYQPHNTKNRIAFRRHVVGLDAEPWDVDSIELFDIEESEENWHWNESKKYGIKFKFPEKLNFNSSDSIAEMARLDSQLEDSWIRTTISVGDAHPIDVCGDAGCYNFPDEFRKKLLEEKSCEILNSEITASSPIYFKSGKPYLCDVFVDEEKGQVSLYALGLDNVYGENLTGIIYVAMENRAILLRGQGLVLEKYRGFVSKELKNMFQNNEKITTTETFIQIRPTDEEIQTFLSKENMEFLKKIVESINVKRINSEEI